MMSARSFNERSLRRPIRQDLMVRPIEMMASRLTAGTKPTKWVPSVFFASRGRNVYPRNVNELRQSVGRTGICFDNSLAESTNGAIKVELVNREEYPTRGYAEKRVARYIELFYNSRRLHSSL